LQPLKVLENKQDTVLAGYNRVGLAGAFNVMVWFDFWADIFVVTIIV